MEAANKLRLTLKDAGYSLTAGRLSVFRYLQENRGPVNVSLLATTLHRQADRATVYRTVALFEKLGIINRVWHGLKNHIELSEIFAPHHHHALCQNCGGTTDISSPALEASLTAVAKQYKFLATTHSVELRGLCAKCQGN